MRVLHFNSISAYHQERDKFGRRALDILNLFSSRHKDWALTDREIKDILFPCGADMNAVRPRITELVQEGWLKEVGTKIDKVTGKSVRLVQAVPMSEMMTPAEHPSLF